MKSVDFSITFSFSLANLLWQHCLFGGCCSLPILESMVNITNAKSCNIFLLAGEF